MHLRHNLFCSHYLWYTAGSLSRCATSSAILFRRFDPREDRLAPRSRNNTANGRRIGRTLLFYRCQSYKVVYEIRNEFDQIKDGGESAIQIQRRHRIGVDGAR